MQAILKKRAILAWAFYDWANSAFGTIVTTFIFAAYFTRKIAVNPITGTKQWGYAIALSGIIIVILSPIFGAIADHRGKRKPWLLLFTCLTMIGSALLWFAYPNPHYIYFTLACVIIGTTGAEISQVFYNALLPTLAPKAYMGRVSGWGWSFGYAGGLVALSIALFGFVQTEPHWLNTNTAAQVRICGPLVAAWIMLFIIPLFLFVKDYPVVECTISQAIHRGLSTLMKTLKTLPQQKNIMLFLIARMIYQDGLTTVFAFGGIYAAGTFGMNITQVIKFGIVMNVAAGLGAASLAWVDDWIGSKRTIIVSLIALTVFAIAIVLVYSVTWFWIFSALLSLFFGPLQATSRSLMTKLVPKEKITEMFGLYALTGKTTAYVGPWLLGTITYHFNSQRIGIAVVILFFILGLLLLLKVHE